MNPSNEILSDGSHVTLRPIRREDRELLRQFINTLSPEARRYRFLCAVAAPSEELLDQLTVLDPARELALIAVSGGPGHEEQIGEARFSAQEFGAAETAVVVSDAWRHLGLGTLLMRRLIEAARERGIGHLYSIDAAQNEAVRELARHLGFQSHRDPQDATQVIYTLELK